MSKEQRFWDWFKLNEARFFFLGQVIDEEEKENILDDFLLHLHEYCDHLFFEIGGFPDGKQDLIITADGNVDFFDIVENLVATAPYLDNWNIIALKPASGNGTISYESITLDAETIYFDPLENPKSVKIGLRVFIEDFAKAREKELLQAVYLLIDGLLGERSAALEIGYVEVRSLSSIPDKDAMIRFDKLPKYVKWNRSKSE